ncbi:hypothetical protein F5141DRAFT_1061635, partial [Pisolithus sp. B1]
RAWTVPADVTCRHLEIVELLHPNDIRFHVAAGIDPYFVEETLNLFSAQFWREQDAVEIREGDLRGKKGALTNVDWHKRSAVVCLGDTLEIIAGPFCGETGYVVALHERTIVLVVMRPNQTSEDSSHFRRTKPYRATLYECMVRTGQTGIIEWISPEVIVEVARGQWRHSQGVVKAVDLIKASLDLCSGGWNSVKERFDYGLSKFARQEGHSSYATFPWKDVELGCDIRQPIELKNNQVRHPAALKSLHNRSFITPVVPPKVTPPPSPGPSNAGPSDAWSITPRRYHSGLRPPIMARFHGFSTPNFCDFKSFHLGFNARPFNTSTIPARYLTPANPTGKNQLCLVLKDLKQEDLNSKSVVTEDGTTIQFSDICVAFEYNRA